jgi:sec-independent protein translocase protein TatC
MAILPRRRQRDTDGTPRRQRIFRRRPLEQRGTMTLLEHLEELRSRLIWIFAAVSVAAIAGWILFDRTVDFLLEPARPYLKDLTNGKLIFTSPIEAFTLRVKVAFYIGFAIAFPVVLFHVWRFVSPGLRRNERRWAYWFIAAGWLLFLGGAWFGWYTMPNALRYLISGHITGANVRPLLGAKSYIDFSLLYVVAFGLGFEFPMGVISAALIGAVNSKQMAKYRRHVFMGLAVASAVLTPSVDWFTMTALTVALYVLYEACIWVTKLVLRR